MPVALLTWFSKKTDFIIILDWAISCADLLAVAAKAKLDCAHWEEVPNDWDWQKAGYGENFLQPLSKILMKLWPFRSPMWAVVIRDRVWQMEALRAKAQTPENNTHVRWTRLLSQSWLLGCLRRLMWCLRRLMWCLRRLMWRLRRQL